VNRTWRPPPLCAFLPGRCECTCLSSARHHRSDTTSIPKRAAACARGPTAAGS